MSNLNPSRENGWSLLHYAAKEGHLKVFKFIANTLVDKNPESSAMEGKTPLHIAAEYGKVEICKYILKKMEEKVSPTNESGVYIRNKKLEVSPKMDNGRTPLHLAAMKVCISSGQRDLMKTYHNEDNTSGISKIASKNFLEFFEQSS